MKDDLIRRQDALDIINHELNGWLTDDERLHLEGCGIGIESLPTAEPERKKGKWIKVLEADETGNATYECPFCHRGEVHCPIVEVKFCWNCGAEMEGDDDD